MIDIKQLHDYQIEARNFVIQTPRCGLFLDLGLGKTLISLASVEAVYKYEKGNILIIAPKSIASTTWADEIRKWNINIPYRSFIVNERGKSLSKAKRLEVYADSLKIHDKRTVYFINRELIKDYIEYCRDKKTNVIKWAFPTIIIDELQSFKGYSSERFKALKSVMPVVTRFIGLTGTPTPNSIEDIWSQIYLMDEGARLGKNISSFRAAYMHPKFVNNGIPVSYEANPGAEDIIYDKIKDIVISMKNTALKLPDITFIRDKVEMDDKEKKLYNEFVDNALLNFEKEAEYSTSIVTAANKAIVVNKFLQYASGGVYTTDEDGNPTGWKFIHDKKLERLKYIRDNSDDNLLVAYYFKFESEMIMEYCKKNGIQCEVFDSSRSKEILDRWNKGLIPMLLIQPASAGFGLNFQYASHTLIWFTLSFNLEHYLQTIGRIYRQGQTKPVFVHILMTIGTADSRVLNKLMTKNANMQALLDAVEYNSETNKRMTAFNTMLSSLSSNNTDRITDADYDDVMYNAKGTDDAT